MADDKRGIFWLASYPKSGNTYLRMFLNSYVTGFPPEINSSWQYAMSDLNAAMHQLLSAVPITHQQPDDWIQQRPHALQLFLQLLATRDAAMKTHHANVIMHDVPLIPKQLTKGGVYIIRDPRDIAASFANHIGATIDDTISLMGNESGFLQKKPLQLYYVLKSWSSHVKSWMDAGFPVFRYEDMLRQPIEVFTEMMIHLGFPDPCPRRIAYAVKQCSFAKLKKQEQAAGFKETENDRTFFRKGKAGSWREDLTTEQADRIEHTHREVMQKVGYV